MLKIFNTKCIKHLKENYIKYAPSLKVAFVSDDDVKKKLELQDGLTIVQTKRCLIAYINNPKSFKDNVFYDAMLEQLEKLPTGNYTPKLPLSIYTPTYNIEMQNFADSMHFSCFFDLNVETKNIEVTRVVYNVEARNAKPHEWALTADGHFEPAIQNLKVKYYIDSYYDDQSTEAYPFEVDEQSNIIIDGKLIIAGKTPPTCYLNNLYVKLSKEPTQIMCTFNTVQRRQLQIGANYTDLTPDKVVSESPAIFVDDEYFLFGTKMPKKEQIDRGLPEQKTYYYNFKFAEDQFALSVLGLVLYGFSLGEVIKYIEEPYEEKSINKNVVNWVKKLASINSNTFIYMKERQNEYLAETIIRCRRD
ncbi:MAG: hypothetical protein ATN35_04760 [Epulopiscium sp. Nele67-Bin004]|nr:MAG: hypothetical protein ATN35_04760 [Epulopiscium sp. Nele67-Bin004]